MLFLRSAACSASRWRRRWSRFSSGPWGSRRWWRCCGCRCPWGAAWSRGAWWHWSGGLLGAAYIAGTVVLAPRLGAATLIAALVAGQMTASLIVDHFGWVGFAEPPISPLRLAGAALIVVGVVLVRR